MQSDKAKQLHIKKQPGAPQVQNTGLYRPNLKYEVLRATNEEQKHAHLLNLLQETHGTGIVYAATNRHVSALTDLLKQSEHAVAEYHGTMSSPQRKESQESFMSGNVKAMIATHAFGMGVDKRDIRFVIHYDLPGSLEAYYEESGRAGRDGLPARCVLLYRLEDRRSQALFLRGGYPTRDDFISLHECLVQMQADTEPVPHQRVLESAPITKDKSRVILSFLRHAAVIEEKRGGGVRLLKPDLSPERVEQLAEEYEGKTRQDKDKLERMMLYGQSPLCLWKMILDYFREQVPWDQCGHCGNCLNPIRPVIEADSTTDLPASDQTIAEAEFKKGDRVVLPQFGEGCIETIQDDKIVVSFGGETRTFKKDAARKV